MVCRKIAVFTIFKVQRSYQVILEPAFRLLSFSRQYYSSFKSGLVFTNQKSDVSALLGVIWLIFNKMSDGFWHFWQKVKWCDSSCLGNCLILCTNKQARRQMFTSWWMARPWNNAWPKEPHKLCANILIAHSRPLLDNAIEYSKRCFSLMKMFLKVWLYMFRPYIAINIYQYEHLWCNHDFTKTF